MGLITLIYHNHAVVFTSKRDSYECFCFAVVVVVVVDVVCLFRGLPTWMAYLYNDIYSRDIPFWSETLGLFAVFGTKVTIAITRIIVNLDTTLGTMFLAKASDRPQERKARGSVPAFCGRVIPVTYMLDTLQAPGVTGLTLELVGPVSM